MLETATDVLCNDNLVCVVCLAVDHLQLGSITAGNWMVESIVGVDQPRNLIYYMATAESPLERHLYASPLIPAPLAPPAKVEKCCPVGNTEPKHSPFWYKYILQLTDGQGMHNAYMDHACQRFVDVVSTFFLLYR